MRRKMVAILASLTLLFGSFLIIDTSLDVIPTVEGATIYVNTTGSGGAYTSIQSAIDASSSGDTIFVFNGTYYERIVVDKTINLVGENKTSTIINGGNNGDVLTVTSNGVTIEQFTVRNSGMSARGIYLNNVQDCIVINNSAIFNSWVGIFLYLSDGNYVIGNYASNNNIGIFVRNSDMNDFLNNSISGNNYEAIRFEGSTDNVAENNVMVGNGFYIVSSGVSGWNTHYIDNSNTVNGRPVRYLKDQIGGKVPQNAGQVILANCADIVVENQNLSRASYGVLLGYSSYNTINDCNLSDNHVGMKLYESSENNISNCNISDCGYGIFSDMYSDSNYVFGNTFINSGYSIFLYYSDGNNIIGNLFFDCSSGIRFNFDSNDLNIIGNIFQENGYGITFSSNSQSTGNLIAYNDFSLNNYGIYFYDGGNKIFHNNFINNTNQAYDGTSTGNQWHDGYPSGGNFWSDYSGVDAKSGPSQNQPDPDGIGDSPYFIDLDSFDEYPLMNPVRKFTSLCPGWNLISIPLIQVQKNLTDALSSIDGYYDAVQWYDITNTSDIWKHHKIGKPFGNDLFEISETMSFWIHINNSKDTIFLYNGTQPTSNQTIQLCKGWNMVGYPSLTSYNRTDGLNNLTFDTHVDAIQWYDSTTKTWYDLGENDYFMPCRGYWVHAKYDCEWEVPL